MHRDLSQYKESVYSKIVVYKDRIVFSNVGNLYGNNTIEKIKDSSTNVEARNKTMVRLIEVLGGVVENRHAGIKTMIDEMKQSKLPEPIFRNEREDFFVTFYNGEYPELYPEELRKEKRTQDRKTQDERTKDRKTQDKKTQDKRTQDEKSQIFNKILEICKEPKGVVEIMESLGYKSRNVFRRNYIKPLLDKGDLIMTIPDKPTSGNQKYIAKK